MSRITDTTWSIKERLLYDPIVKGYDTSFFKTLSGTPTISGGNIRLSSATIISYTQYLYGDFRFLINIPTSPSEGEDKQWGLRHAATLRGSMVFDITGDVFTFQTTDKNSNATTTTITWDTHGETWAGGMVEYRIVWNERYIKAYVSNELVANHPGGYYDFPEPLYINNQADQDNVDIDYIVANQLGNLTT